MSGVSFPVTRPVGRALIVGNAACRGEVVRLLEPQGYSCVQCDDPYAAMIELCRHRLAYQSLILCLASLYREELLLIATVKRRLPHVEIWLAQTDGRMAALAEGVRLGADGLVAEDGSLHRMAATGHNTSPSALDSAAAADAPSHMGTGGTQISGDDTPQADQSDPPAGIDTSAAASASSSGRSSSMAIPDVGIGEPVLTADELRALLQDQPSMPPSGTE